MKNISGETKSTVKQIWLAILVFSVFFTVFLGACNVHAFIQLPRSYYRNEWFILMIKLMPNIALIYLIKFSSTQYKAYRTFEENFLLKIIDTQLESK